MNKGFISLISTFLTLIMITSCITTSPKNNTINIDSTQKSLNESKAFNIKNIETVPEQEIKIIERDADEPVTVNLRRDFPKNSPMKIEDMEITPVNRTINVNKGLTTEEIRDARKSLLKQWRVWYHSLVKVLRNEVNKKFQEDDKKAKEDYEAELLKYRKGTTEYNNVVKNYKKETEERRKLQKEQREQFKQAVKKDWQNIKDTINKNYPKNDKTFSVKFDPFTILTAVLVYSIAALVSFLGIELVKEVIKDFTTKKPQPPTTVNDTPTTINIAKENKDVPIEPITTVTPQQPADTKPVQTNNTTVTYNTPTQVKTKDDSMQKIIDALLQANDIKVAIPFRLKDIFKAAGITNYPNILNNCVEVPITDLSRLSTTICGDYIGVVSFKDLPTVEVQSTPEGKILMNFELSDKRIINTTGGKTMSFSEWVISLADRYLPSNWGSIQATNGGKAIDIIRSLSNKTLKFSLESPKICNQGIKSQFSSNNIVSFQAELAKSILFEGDYTYSLFYEDKTNPSDKKDIKSGTINIMNYISGNNSKPEWRLSKKLNMLGRGMFDASNSEEQLPNSKFGYYITNQVGDLWDMKIDRLGDSSCKPIYTAHCIDTKKADITFAKGGFDTGIYRLETRYNIYDTVKGVNLNQINTNYIDTLITRINYSTFARLSDKAEQNQIYANTINKSGNTNSYQLSSESYGYYYDPISNDISNIEPIPFNNINIPSDINSESSEYLKQLVSVPNWRKDVNLQEGNLLTSLASPSGVSPFKTTDVKSCTKDKYLNVGAVIDLTNKKYYPNNYLDNKAQNIPIIVAIEKDNQRVKEFFYSVRLGRLNIIQSYWDGKIDTNNDDLNDDDNFPDYTSGQYTIKVYVDHGVLDRSYKYTTYNRLQDVIFTTPYISTTSTNATININDSNDCTKCLEPTIKTKVTENIDSILAQSNDIKFDDMYAMASNFSIASINVARPIDITQVDVIKLNYYNLKQALEDLKKAFNSCNSQEINKKRQLTYQIASSVLEYNRASLERIYSTVPPTGTTNGIPPQAPKTPQDWEKIKKVVELTRKLSTFAKRSIIFYLTTSTLDLLSANNSIDRAIRNFELGEKIVQISERVDLMEAKTLTKECAELGFDDNLANIRLNAIDIYSKVETYYRLMKDKITIGDGQGIIYFESMAPELENKINEANTKLNTLSAQLETECGDNSNSCDPNKKNLYVTKGLEFAYKIPETEASVVTNVKKLIPYLDGKTFGVINHKYDISSIVGILFADSATYLPPNTFPDLNSFMNTAINRNTNKCILKYLNEVKNNAPNERSNIIKEYEQNIEITRNLFTRNQDKKKKVIARVDNFISNNYETLIAHSGNTIIDNTIKTPEEYFPNIIDPRRFDVYSKTYNVSGQPERWNDAEVKIFEYIARLPQYNVINRLYTIPNLNNPQVERVPQETRINESDGFLIIYSSPLETCQICRENLFRQFKKVFPNLLLIPIQPN